jgi:glycosyltransferase involved in cell wall biosynthesis
MVYSDDKLYNDYIIAINELDDSYDLKSEKSRLFPYRPKISIITPVYNTDGKWLRLAIESVVSQIYDNWELCIADGGSTKEHVKAVLYEYAKKDSRIKVKFLDRNKGIAGNSNEALSLATGDFIAFLDHDDVLAPFALFEVVRAINENQDVDFIYSDEDKISNNSKKRFGPHFKPDWAPDTFRSHNYICHFTVIRKRIIDEIEGFREGFDGSQDYDLFLRAVEKTQKIVHIPKVLYHWRSHELSVASDPKAKMYAYDSAKRALTEHLQRIGCDGDVEDGFFLGTYRIRYRIENLPFVTIIIPTRDKVDVLRKCIESIIDKSTYSNYKILIVDNQSIEEETFNYYERLKDNPKIEMVKYDNVFNYSAINNYAVSYASSEYLIFLNNDTEVITPDWIECMLEFAQRKDMGVVGCLLFFPDDAVQHAGVIVGLGGVAGHPFHRFSKDSLGYMGRIRIIQNLSAVTAACLMTKKSIFEEVGGLDENYSHAFNDIDLCLKIRERGYFITYTPYAELYHHESLSRGYEDNIRKYMRFAREIKYFEKKWKGFLEKGDPYYNPNLTLNKGDFSVKDITETAGYFMQIHTLSRQVHTLSRQVHTLSGLIQEKDSQIHSLNKALCDKNVHISNLEIHAGNLERFIRDKDTHISNLEIHAGNLERFIRDKDTHISNLETMVRDKEVTLDNIYNSTGWKMLLILYKVRDKFLPPNTWRRSFIKNLLNIIRK